MATVPEGHGGNVLVSAAATVVDDGPQESAMAIAVEYSAFTSGPYLDRRRAAGGPFH
jgi:hypothetical protein